MDDALALVRRGWEHLHRQQPLAAWACWQQALRIAPDDPAATAALARLESSPTLPAAATVAYRFRPPGAEDRRQRWDAALRGRDLADLADAAVAFDGLADADPDDTAALYNAALCHAWTGANTAAIAALARVVERNAPADPESAVAAWTLAEVLRHGAGAEALADDLTYLLTTPRPARPAALVPPDQVRPVELPELEAAGPGDALAFEWLDRPMPAPDGVPHAASLPHVLASVVASGTIVRYATPLRDHIDEVEERLLAADATGGSGEWERATSVLPLSLLDAAVFTFRLPRGLDDDAAAALTREAIEGYFENSWIHEPRRGLDPASGSYLTPLAAARRAGRGDLAMRARLDAVVRLREQLGSRPGVATMYAGYPFDRLRRRLGLEPRVPESLDPDDYACMSPAELGGLDPAVLDEPRLLEATRSARGLFDFGQAARFAAAIVDRDPTALVRVEPPWLVRVLAEGALAGPDPDPVVARVWIERAIELAAAPGSGTTEDALEGLWDELTGGVG
jgi:tetratricopeptide (TPR) repeat protein